MSDAKPPDFKAYKAHGPHHLRYDTDGVYLDGKALHATSLDIHAEVDHLTRVTVVLDVYPHDVVVDLPADFTVETRPRDAGDASATVHIDGREVYAAVRDQALRSRRHNGGDGFDTVPA